MLLCIENVPQDATEQEIQQLFSSYGNVRSVRLQPSSSESKQAASGVVEMDGVQAKGVVAALDRRLFKDAILRVQEVPVETPAQSTQVKPRQRSTAPNPAGPNNRNQNTLHVISVEEIDAAGGGQADNWCRYTITSRAASITGLRQGSVADVTRYAEEAAEAFNQRNMLGAGRPPIWSSRQKK
ncbi:MAG: RNA-binding protein [Chromatiaceae bacterium]|nr:RNA-binding protein [Chromatiaceae bacterium]MCP5313915.1 RNA-binding protein [Chromatiaceae bacterium]